MIDYRKKTITKGQQQLRCGYTTGTCAAAAAKAAAVALLTGEICRDVAICLPGGENILLETETLEHQKNCVKCGVIKDAGDDPDITNGLMICAAVEKNTSGEICIDGGEGVGRVTQPGLDQPVGAAAINSVPRKMIQEAVESVCRQYHYTEGLMVTISIPKGRETAEKTLNPMLGIVGGLSVLGTTGIVEPMSEKALIDTIAVDIRRHRAQGEDILVMAPGNYGLDYLKAACDIHSEQVIKISNFVGDSIDLAVCEGASGIVLAGHIGKLIKVAGGIMNIHSHQADARMEILTAYAAVAGADGETLRLVMKAVTTDAGMEILQRCGLLSETMQLILGKIQAHVQKRAGGRVETGIIIFSNVYGLLGQTENVPTMLAELAGKT